MEILKKIFGGPKECAIAVSGLSLVGLYLFYVRKHVQGEQKKPLKNELELPLKKLIEESKNGQAVKIVITESSDNKR